MALTKEEQGQVLALVAKEGGLAAFAAEVSAAHVAVAQDAAVSVLEKAVRVSVDDWPAVDAYVAAATNSVLYTVTGSIMKATAGRDDSQLGPLLITLYGAVKAHLSL